MYKTAHNDHQNGYVPPLSHWMVHGGKYSKTHGLMRHPEIPVKSFRWVPGEQMKEPQSLGSPRVVNQEVIVADVKFIRQELFA